MKHGIFGISTLVMALALSACSSDSPPAGEFVPANIGACGTAGSSNSKCTKAEDDAYGKCLIEKCDASYKKCWGPEYKSGTFGGECGGYLNCSTKCGCADTACRQGCQAMLTPGCTECSSDLGTCAQNSSCKTCAAATTPSGGTGAGGSTAGGASCAALAACCASMSGKDKDECTRTLDQYKMAGATADQGCGIGLMIYKMSMKCK